MSRLKLPFLLLQSDFVTLNCKTKMSPYPVITMGSNTPQRRRAHGKLPKEGWIMKYANCCFCGLFVCPLLVGNPLNCISSDLI